jgi:hypothetical protein
MSKTLVFKNKTKKDMFDEGDKLVSIMTPKTFLPSKFTKSIGASGDQVAFLQNGFPMYLDRTVLYTTTDGKAEAQKLVGMYD